jgi:pimeloyl-ACP methyl ester carboxylesterase
MEGPSPHVTRLVTVDQGVKLEVLDWGGSGRPLVLLAGGGNTAHVFDDFTPKLTDHYRVYGIKRPDSVLPVTQTRRIRRTASATTWWQ